VSLVVNKVLTFFRFIRLPASTPTDSTCPSSVIRCISCAYSSTSAWVVTTTTWETAAAASGFSLNYFYDLDNLWSTSPASTTACNWKYKYTVWFQIVFWTRLIFSIGFLVTFPIYITNSMNNLTNRCRLYAASFLSIYAKCNSSQFLNVVPVISIYFISYGPFKIYSV
jgi:hypothetical protein